jgi:hypothetical protein
MSKNETSYREMRAIAEHCFLFPQLSTMNEEFVGEFMFNHEAIAADLKPDEDRKARSDRTVQIMEDANTMIGLLFLKDMTPSELNEHLAFGKERMEQALASVIKSGTVFSYMEEKIRYYTLAEK